jgi:hypothetical protein
MEGYFLSLKVGIRGGFGIRCGLGKKHLQNY